MDSTEVAVVRQRMRVVGESIGTEEFRRDFLQETVDGKPNEFVKALVPMEVFQASF